MTGTAFCRALLDPSLPIPVGLTDPQGRPDARRFAVYRNNVTVGLTGALEAGFPVIRKLVGDEFFAAMARDFVRANPPASPVMLRYGTGFPAFLAEFPPVAHLPYLADVAKLEIALRESYHAADAAPVSADAFARIPPDSIGEARLCLAPALRLIRSPHPVFSIWCANVRSTAACLCPGAQDVLVLRPGFDPEPHLVPAAAATFLEALQAGETLGRAITASGPTLDLDETLVLLVAGGGVTGLEEA
jgi:hypothetical protein